MKSKILIVATIIILLLSFTFGCSSPTGGISPEEFYKENTVTMIVPWRAGGGTDRLARVLQRYLEAHLETSVVIENKDAAGGLEGQNYVYEVAKKDGLTICVTEASAMWGSDLMNAEGVAYDIEEFAYIAAMQTTVHILWVLKDSPYNSLDDLKAAKGLKMGVAGSLTSSGGPSCAIVIEAAGLDAKLIPGFRGSSPTILALQKGEIDTIPFPGEGMQQYVDDGTIKGLCTMANTNEYSFYKDLPVLSDIVDLTSEQKDMLDVLESLRGTKALFTTPGAPKDRVEYLEKVFMDIADRDDFQQEAGQAMGYWPGAIGIDESTDLVKSMKEHEDLFPDMVALAEKYAFE
jgi:tripartite-type tricarboxylate transporter receptor subunit TctC